MCGTLEVCGIRRRSHLHAWGCWFAIHLCPTCLTTHAGQKSIRPYWRNYFDQTDALVSTQPKCTWPSENKSVARGVYKMCPRRFM
jgi:hypothetical protein